jgi:hypothetical protein
MYFANFDSITRSYSKLSNMARRPQEKILCRVLMDNGFAFVGNGPKTIIEIYDSVQAQYHEFCDDQYLCINHCRKGSNQPEWKHAVRSVLGSMK